MSIRTTLGIALVSSLTITGNTLAATDPHAHHQHDHADGHHHADTMLMGTHIHGKGEWMISYRYMRMNMEDNRIGTSDIDPDTIVTTIPNRFAGIPGQPPTLRVVPTEMSTDMHMLGLMYAPSDDLTLMTMVPYIEKQMDHITYMGGAGTTQLGTFTTRTNGIGDIKVTGLYRLHDSGMHHVHANFGLSLPTGSNTETDNILTPMGMMPTVRLPYPMQPGSGTYDILAGMTYAGMSDVLSWGVQYAGTFRTGSDEGYTLGDVHKLSGWLGKQLNAFASVAARLSYLDVGNIDGIDPNIVAPVQTADPDRQGKQRWDVTLELNLAGNGNGLKGHRLGLEITMPVHQDLDGPQLKSDLMFGLAYQKTF